MKMMVPSSLLLFLLSSCIITLQSSFVLGDGHVHDDHDHDHDHHDDDDDDDNVYKIVLLGDSYTSGTGARNESGHPDFYGPEGCYRSRHSWGEQFVQYLNNNNSTHDINNMTATHNDDDTTTTPMTKSTTTATTTNMTSSKKDVHDDDDDDRDGKMMYEVINGACGGSHVDHLTTGWTRRSIKGPCPTDMYPDDDEYYTNVTTANSTRCDFTLQPQIEYHLDKTVDMVIMTTGGNDIGFANIVAACMGGPMISDAVLCKSAVEGAYLLMESMKEDLITALVKIEDSIANDGILVHVSYPYIVLDVNFTLSDPATNLTYDVPTSIREMGNIGDIMTMEAIEEAHNIVGREYIIFFNTTKEIFHTHEPEPRFNMTNEQRWFYEVYEPIANASEYIHYNQMGHNQLAISMYDIIGPQIMAHIQQQREVDDDEDDKDDDPATNGHKEDDSSTTTTTDGDDGGDDTTEEGDVDNDASASSPNLLSSSSLSTILLLFISSSSSLLMMTTTIRY